jgi:type III secretion protein C
MMSYARRFRCCWLVLALFWSGWSCAGDSPWPEVPFKYFARQYPLPRVMNDFANTFGLKLELSPLVEGQVSGDYSAATPAQFLNAITSSYGLDWYYQDGVLHVGKSLEWVTRVLHVGLVGRDVSSLKAELSNLGVYEPRFGWAEFPERGVVIVAGPLSYVNEVTSIVTALGTTPSDGRQIRIFRLLHARAEDYTFTYHDQRVVTPGVATLLRNLAAGSISEQQYSPSSGPLTVASAGAELPVLSTLARMPTAAVLPGVLGAPAGNAGTSPADARPNNDTAHAAPNEPPASSHAGLTVLTPVIEADPRLNAVIVYDAPEKMPIYEELIRQLDAGMPQIQIEAMVVDVDTDSVDTLGVDWEAHAGDASFGFGGGNNQATLLSIHTSSFVARLHALASKGRARILGRPSLITLDNLVAVLSLSETFYARVSGGGGGGGGRGGGVGSSGGLVPITTGTLLKVIPRLVEENGRRDVSMAVEIQDGQIHPSGHSGEDSLPTVSESNINTQAVVHEDDSLLIGGYFMDNDSDQEQGVPGLSKIPLLGALFRDKHSQHSRSERLFIIRPHLVMPGAPPSADAAAGRLPAKPAAAAGAGAPQP